MESPAAHFAARVRLHEVGLGTAVGRTVLAAVSACDRMRRLQAVLDTGAAAVAA
jgi:hypothetical protein